MGGEGTGSAVKQRGSVKIASPCLGKWLRCCRGVNRNTSFLFECLQAFFFNNLSFLGEKKSRSDDLCGNPNSEKQCWNYEKYNPDVLLGHSICVS